MAIALVTLGNENVKNAPFFVNVSAGASAGNSFIEGFSFVIKALDSRGEARKDGGDDFKVEITGPTTPAVKVEDLKNGSYHVSYKVTERGEYSIHVSTNGENIKGTPVKQVIQ